VIFLFARRNVVDRMRNCEAVWRRNKIASAPQGRGVEDHALPQMVQERQASAAGLSSVSDPHPHPSPMMSPAVQKTQASKNKKKLWQKDRKKDLTMTKMAAQNSQNLKISSGRNSNCLCLIKCDLCCILTITLTCII